MAYVTARAVMLRSNSHACMVGTAHDGGTWTRGNRDPSTWCEALMTVIANITREHGPQVPRTIRTDTYVMEEGRCPRSLWASVRPPNTWA